MSIPTSPLRRAGSAVAAMLTLAIATPAQAGATAKTGADCSQATPAQTFMPWLDPAWYVPAPDGGLERKGTGWELTGSAKVVDQNEPYYVGGGDDKRSLHLGPGASGTTPAMCITAEHPTVRFFLRNAGAADAALTVSVTYRDGDGRRQSLTIGVVTGSSAWAPSPALPVTVNLLSLMGDGTAAFSFTPADDRGDWSIDDVYVDPYSKG